MIALTVGVEASAVSVPVFESHSLPKQIVELLEFFAAELCGKKIKEINYPTYHVNRVMFCSCVGSRKRSRICALLSEQLLKQMYRHSNKDGQVREVLNQDHKKYQVK